MQFVIILLINNVGDLARQKPPVERSYSMGGFSDRCDVAKRLPTASAAHVNASRELKHS